MHELFPNGTAHYLVGGLLIGTGVASLFATSGPFGSASTLFGSTWSFVSRDAFFQLQLFLESSSRRLVSAAGRVRGALLVTALSGVGPTTSVPWPQLLVGGLVAGF